MLYINDQLVEVKYFPDGTLKLNISTNEPDVTIQWLYEKNEEMILFYIVHHLRERFDIRNLKIYMPYIPNARMDRVKGDDEVFTLKYFCQFINSLNFDKVIVRDAHSYVSLALLDRVVEESVIENIEHLLSEILNPEDIVFYPDEGSCKRYSKSIRHPYAFGLKNRDWSSGEIVSLDVEGHIPEDPFNVLIVDDISSYGGTFLCAARKLKELGAQKIYLYVTHCENSVLNGEMIESGLVETIYTTRSIYTASHPKIKVIGG